VTAVADDVDRVDLARYLAECRAMVLDEIRAMVPQDGRAARVLYDLMLDYPMRDAKGLRPALCVAACRALGGPLEGALPSAAVLELYHNAFLIHDDVEDRSEKRRDALTLQRLHGVPIAVNVGDAMLALALRPLLDNMHRLDMGRALRILETVAAMARESAEGQAIELDWVRRARWDLTDDDYLGMVDQKTGWYSFIAPVRIGAIVAGASAEVIAALHGFAAALGAAFQIQDDVLNLQAREADYGKEIAGDLWEGKHTLILLHALRAMGDDDRARALAILDRPRPDTVDPARDDLAGRLRRLVPALAAEGRLDADGRARLEALVEDVARTKTRDDVEWLLAQIERHGSLGYAREVARRRASAAGAMLASWAWMKPSVHRAVLQSLVDYVVERDR
jgi:geranylgeranyl diphosphate synthase, type II